MKKNNSTSDFSRRKFIGLSAMATAALYGSSVFGLSSCKKDTLPGDKEEIPNPPIYGEDTEVVVIGSGFGGAVAALRMTEAGLNTIMLEMGKQYEVTDTNRPFSSTFSPDGRSTWLRNGTILPFGPSLPIREKGLGVLDRVDYENMKVYRGTCLGGGSVVYGAMLPQANRLLWDNEFPDINYDEMNSIWYPKVRSVLPVTRRVPDDILNSNYYQYARVGLKQCVKAGMEEFYIPGGVDFDIIRDEIEGRTRKYTTNGDLLYGVNNGAKHSVDRNYIPAAIGTGKLTVQTMSKVHHIEELKDGRYEVLVERIDDKGKVTKQHTIRANYVFVCAGVVGTNGILLRSQHEGGLPNLERVGEHVGTNGNIMSVRGKFDDEVGAKQCIVPVSGYYQPDNPHGIMLAEQAPVPLGFETGILGVLGITINEYRGHFKVDPNHAAEGVSLEWDVNGLAQGLEAMKDFTGKLLDANGGQVITSIFPNNGYSNNFTYHPLGGVVRGISSDSYGRLKGHKRIYCVDGSMIPGYTCAANPAMTIAAVAERCLDDIVKNDLF
ncbi:MAG: GMC family oxidoreductase N-terminal domain-containing protein [Chitinophagales bacterium]|nr:GMC family oxidoreductase N-terminal domain-containing protein [Chitinophagales bacterium]